MKTNQINPCNEIHLAMHQDPTRAEDLPREWETHLKECAACQLEVRAALRLLDLLRQAGSGFELHGSPEKLAQEAIAQANRRSVKPRPFHGFSWKPAAALALGAALAVAAFGWWRTRNSSSGPAKISTAPAAATFEIRFAERIGRDGKRQILPHDATEITANGEERILLTFSEGTRVQLNEKTRVRLESPFVRALRVEEGEILVDVVRQQGLEPLRIRVPDGVVRVVGTRLLVRALANMSVVNVLRGHVVAESDGHKADIHAGGEAMLRRGREPLVRAASSLDRAMEWAGRFTPPDTGHSGFGSLRARKPGSTQDTELRLADRIVDVKIQGRIARTEIEEAFFNDSHETLEGIYTFPLPADAQIAALDLEVNGKWEHGAIVEKQRGDKIWAGVIRNATPKAKKHEIVEYVWVPGPWHDPALLNWKKGSEFEMRIFPIPAKGARRVRIAYTQVLEPIPGGARYVLPMPAGKKAAAEHFRLTAQVGHFPDAQRLRAFPYDVKRSENAGGVMLEYESSKFEPRGDWVLEIPETEPDREIRAWAYRPEPGTAAACDDFGVVALRPRLPAFMSTRPLEWVFVVDRSWSTQHARLQMTARMVAALVEGLDTGHHVQVWACNHECRRIRGRAFASADESQAIQKTIEDLEPIGSTSMDAVIDALEQEIRGGGLDPKQTRIVYIGDGVVSAGETQPDRIAEKIGRKIAPARFSTVAMGGSADESSLRAWARAAGGSALFLKAGEAPETFAGKVLQRQLSVPLENARIEFPSTVRDVSPEKLELWPGEEVLLSFCGTWPEGNLTLSGTLDGMPFSRNYTVKLDPQPGNLFVPRLWAQGRIRDLEARTQTPETVKEIVNISKNFHVLSRHTSLLVLESPAMAKAFGVEDTRPKLDFTGTEDVRESNASGPDDAEDDFAAAGKTDRGALDFEAPAAGAGLPKKMSQMPAPLTSASEKMETMPPPRRRMVLMRREWYRKASIRAPRDTEEDTWMTFMQRKEEYEQKPDSRDRLKALVDAALAAGRADEAQKHLDAWLQKDPMDAQALLVQAEIAFLHGDPARAADFIESAVDVENLPVLHARLANLYRASGNSRMACAHALPRAIAQKPDIDAIVEAARCTGDNDRFLSTLKAPEAARAKKLLAQPETAREPSDQLTLEAFWEGDGQVDLAVITPEGRVASFAGGANRVKAASVESVSTEKLAISMERRGKYQILAVPRAQNRGRPIQGRIKIASYGVVRTFPFAVADRAQAVAVVSLYLDSRLIPVRR